jgi:hypothetical protein
MSGTSTDTAKARKTLADFLMPPSRDGYGYIPHVYYLGAKGKHGAIHITNNSKRALRVVIFDETDDYMADKAEERRRLELKLLADLQKKYPKGK